MLSQSPLKLRPRYMTHFPPIPCIWPRFPCSSRGCPEPPGKEGHQLHTAPRGYAGCCSHGSGLSQQRLLRRVGPAAVNVVSGVDKFYSTIRDVFPGSGPCSLIVWIWKFFHLFKDFLGFLIHSFFWCVCLNWPVCFCCLQLKTLTLKNYGLWHIYVTCLRMEYIKIRVKSWVKSGGILGL